MEVKKLMAHLSTPELNKNLNMIAETKRKQKMIQKYRFHLRFLSMKRSRRKIHCDFNDPNKNPLVTDKTKNREIRPLSMTHPHD